MKLLKRLTSLLLVACMLAGLAPSSLTGILASAIPEVKADYTWDPSDVNIPITFDGTSMTRGEAMATTLKYSNSSGVNWKHPGSFSEFRKLMESTAAEDTYISLTKDLEAYEAHSVFDTIEIEKGKVLDLNGHLIDFRIDSNVRPWSYWGYEQTPYERDDEAHYMNTAFEITKGATVHILDSSTKRSYNGESGKGEIYIHGYMLNIFGKKKDYGGRNPKVNYYPSFDLFKVSNGNLLIYGGNFQAGRSKAMMDSNFSWEKLKTVIGQAVELGASVASFATGIDAAVAAKEDVIEGFNKIKDNAEQVATSNKNEKKEEKGKDPDNKDTLKTVKEKQEDIDKKASSDADHSLNKSENGEQKTNENGSAKADKDKKTGKQSAISEANKKIVDSVLDQSKITDIVSKTYNIVKGIAGMTGSNHESTIIQHHFGTCVRLGNKGTFVSYGGHYKGYGSTPNTRNAVIEAERNSKAYIYGGTFDAMAGANVFNIVEALNKFGNGQMQQVEFDKNGNPTYKNITISPTETMNLMEVKVDSEGDPIDTSNIIVRGGTFKCYYEAKNVGVVATGDDRYSTIMGTSGAVNLGLGSFNENFIKDGRIQIDDIYGNGALVLMDENTGGNGELYHYRLFCSDLELRYKQGLRVYPNTALTNTTNTFSLVTQYNDGDSNSIAEVLSDDEKGENIRGAYSTTEKVFYYPIKSTQSKSYTLRPYFENMDPNGENLGSSPTWYYQDPTTTENVKIEPLTLSDKVLYGSLNSSATANYQNSDPNQVYNSFNSQLNTVTSTFGGKTYVDYRTISDTSAKNLGKVFANYSTFDQSYQYMSNMKWFEFKVFQVDPLTRLNIRKDGLGVAADDSEPLATARYGADVEKGLKTLIRLTDLEEKLKAQNTSWKGFRQGEMYRVELSVEERLNSGYNGYNIHNTNVTKNNYDEYYFTNSLGTAKASSSILFMCYGPEERTVNEQYNNQTQDFTPLQWLNKPSPGGLAQIEFVNAMPANVDWDTTRIFDLYYQWWTVDDNGKPDQLIAGTTNIWDIAEKYKAAKAENLTQKEIAKRLNQGKQDHALDKMRRGKDDYQYANTIAPWDKSKLDAVDESGNKVVYGEDGLPKIEYTSGGQIKSGTNKWPADLDVASKLIHAYSTEWMDPDDLVLWQDNLTNNNNLQWYGRYDVCYIPPQLGGKKIMVKAIAVNVNWTNYYDAVQTFYSHTFQMGPRRFDEPVEAGTKVTYGSKGNYASISNSVTLSLGEVTGMDSDEYVSKIWYRANSKNKAKVIGPFELKKGDPIPKVKFPDDFFSKDELRGKGSYAKLDADEFKLNAYILTNFDSDTADRFDDTDVIPVSYEVEPERIVSNKDSYTFDIEDLKSGKYTSGTIDLFTVFPTNYSIKPDFDSASSTNEDVASVDGDGRLAFGGKAGTATLSMTGPDGKKSSIEVTVIDYVDPVEITDIDPPTIGSADFDSEVTIPEGADYHVKEIYWTDVYGNRLEAGAVARNYRKYTINIVIERNDPSLVWRDPEGWRYSSYHTYTMYADLADGGQDIISDSALHGQFDYVQDPATGEYEPGETCTYTYTYVKAIGAAESEINEVNMVYPTEVLEGGSVDEWMDSFITTTNGADEEFSFKKGFTFGSFAEQTFEAYGYDVDINDPADTMKAFVAGTVDGPRVDINLNPEGDATEVEFAEAKDMKVTANGEVHPNTSILVGGQTGIFTVPDSITILEGKSIPVLPKYRVLDFNLYEDEEIELDNLLVTEGELKLEIDLTQMTEETAQYYTYNEETNILEAIAESPGAILIPLYVTIDGDGDGVVDMRVNVNRNMKVYASKSQADANDPVDNGSEGKIEVTVLAPDGTESFHDYITGYTTSATSLMTLDIPEEATEGAFITDVKRERGGEFKWEQTAWSGRIRGSLMGGRDKITVITTDVKDITVKTSPTEIYPEFVGIDNLCVSLDGDHWTASKIAFTGLKPDTEYQLYYRQGLSDIYYTKIVRTDPEGTDLGVYVGRNPITEKELGNLERDHYHYDPQTKTLTLKDFVFEDMGVDVESFNFFWYKLRAQSIIYSKDDLTIELIGDNVLTKTGGESDFILGNIIRSEENITITGDGNLTLTGSGMTQAIQPGKGKNVYLTGTGKQTFSDISMAYFMDGGKVYYENGEIKFYGYLHQPTAKEDEFVISEAVHDLKFYGGKDDYLEVSKFWLSNAEITQLQAEFGSGVAGVRNYNQLHLVPQHDFSKEVASDKYYVSGENTCAEGAVYYKSCACGAPDMEHTFTAPAGNHDLVHHEGKAATCTEDGYKAYDTCTKCNYTTFEAIPSTGHTFVHHDEVAATCETDGCPAYDTCSVCGFCTLDKTIAASLGIQTMEEGAEVERDDLWVAHGHDTVYVPEVAATCTEAGCHGYYKCQHCGETFSDAEGHEAVDISNLTIDAGHSLTVVSRVAPTEETDGNIQYYICSGCDKWFADPEGTTEIKDHNSVIIPAGTAPTKPEISQKTAELTVFETLTLTVVGGVVTTWMSGDEAIAEVTEDGEVTAMAEGETTITATLENGITLTCAITVKAPEGPVISKTEAKLALGSTLKLLVAGGTVTGWSTSDEAIATVAEDGTVTAVALGEATITATLDDESTLTCALTVVDEPVISKETTSLVVGKTLTLTVTNGEVKSWASDNTAVATVDAAGKVTAVKAGTATITASLKGGIKLTCVVTVTAKPTISATKATLKAGKTKTLTVKNGTVKSWKSSKASVAKVSTKGVVTALKKGTATITATLKDGTKLTCKITVSTSPTITVGGKKFKASTTYKVKKGKYLTVKVTGRASSVANVYSTTKKTIAKVTTTNKKTSTIKIKGLKKGSATVTIKINGVAFKIKVKVT